VNRQMRKSSIALSIKEGDILAGDSFSFFNVNFYKSTFTQLKCVAYS